MIACEPVRRVVKLVDIGYVTMLYFAAGTAAAIGIDKLFGEYDQKKDEAKPLWRVFFELVGFMWLVGSLVYIVRNTFEFIPFPLDGVCGFHHLTRKELSSASVFIFTLMLFSFHLRYKMYAFFERLSGKKLNVQM
jgi:hypothetical protein